MRDRVMGSATAGNACTSGPLIARCPSLARCSMSSWLPARSPSPARGTFEPGGRLGGDHHGGAPIWVLSRREPGIDVSQWPLVTYVNDVTTAMTEAKRAAGEKNVLVHGAATAQLALAGRAA